MKLLSSPKVQFALVLFFVSTGMMMFIAREPDVAPAPAVGGGGAGGQGGGEGAAGAAGSAGGQAGAAGGGGQAGAGGAAQGAKKGGEAQQPPPATGTPATPAQEEPQGFFAKWRRRLQVLFGPEGKGLSFFQRLNIFMNGGAVSTGEGPAAPAPPAGPPPAKGPAEKAAPGAPDTSVNDEVQRQIKENLNQTLEQQKMMRDLQEMQRQNLENTRTMIQSQQQMRQSAENSKTLRETSKKR